MPQCRLWQCGHVGSSMQSLARWVGAWDDRVCWGTLCVSSPLAMGPINPSFACLLRCSRPLALGTKVQCQFCSLLRVVPQSRSSLLWRDSHSSRIAMVKASSLTMLVVPSKSLLIWNYFSQACFNSSLMNKTSSSCMFATTPQSGRVWCSPWACANGE